MSQQRIKIIADTREQAPFEFSGYAADIERGTLPAGDYSVKGMERLAAVERKSIADLVGTLTTGRERFERELAILKGYVLAAVVVEGSIDDIRQANYRSKASPEAVMQSCYAFQVRYRVPFLFCCDRRNAEHATFGLLSKTLREVATRYERIVKAHGPLVAA